MKHLKLSKELTVGQNLLATILILILALISFNPTYLMAAGEDTSAASSNGSITITQADGTKVEIAGTESELDESKDNSCESIEKNLNEKLRNMSKSCSGTDLRGSCLQSLFQCSGENADSEECDSFNDTVSANSSESEKLILEDQKDELKKLEKDKEKLEEKQSDAIKEISENNENLNDKEREINALDDELKANLEANKNKTSQELAKIQSDIMAIEDQNQQLIASLAGQEKLMTQFMLESQLKCKSESSDKAKNFYNTLRACMSGQLNCNIGFNDFMRNAHKTPAQIAKSYERKQMRSCLRVDSDTEFSLKYRAMRAEMDKNKAVIKTQQNTLAAKRANLTAKINIAVMSGQVADSEANLKKAKSLNVLTSEKNQLSSQGNYLNQKVAILSNDIKAKQEEIDNKTDAIAKTKYSLTSSLSKSDLGNLREAVISADYLLQDAKSAVEDNSCGCTGAFAIISRYSGDNISGCSIASDEEEEVDVESITDITE